MRLFLALLTFLPLPLLAASSLASTPDLNGSPEECRSILTNEARLACYDSFFLQEQEESSENLENVSTDGIANISKKKFRYRLFDQDFAIQPHKASFLLPYTYSKHINSEPFNDLRAVTNPDQTLEQEEVKFQISFKIPLAQNVLLNDATLWAGYSQLSLWQMYNTDASAPFRETNYEPELFWQLKTDYEAMGLSINSLTLGFNHQSNGRGSDLSRSWNRIYAEANLSHNRWSFAIKPWYRIPENEDDDDNPDIDDYLGYADYSASYFWDTDLILTTRLRQSHSQSANHTSVNVGLIFPLPGPLNGYLEYVNGYGETLIDYNHRIKRVGIGFILNEWK